MLLPALPTAAGKTLEAGIDALCRADAHGDSGSVRGVASEVAGAAAASLGGHARLAGAVLAALPPDAAACAPAQWRAEGGGEALAGPLDAAFADGAWAGAAHVAALVPGLAAALLPHALTHLAEGGAAAVPALALATGEASAVARAVAALRSALPTIPAAAPALGALAAAADAAGLTDPAAPAAAADALVAACGAPAAQTCTLAARRPTPASCALGGG